VTIHARQGHSPTARRRPPAGASRKTEMGWIQSRRALSGSGGLAPALVLALSLSAGELEPPGPPAPTMKSLDEIPGSWSQLLDSTDGGLDGCDSSRFKCVMGGEAVLDLETGLVWERSPTTHRSSWAIANLACSGLVVGPRRGWRLPGIDKLQSLVDPAQTNPSLPPGHPFVGVQGARRPPSSTEPRRPTRATRRSPWSSRSPQDYPIAGTRPEQATSTAGACAAGQRPRSRRNRTSEAVLCYLRPQHAERTPGRGRARPRRRVGAAAHPFGVFYNSTTERWAIFNQDIAPIPLGATFNLLIFDLLFADGFESGDAGAWSSTVP